MAGPLRGKIDCYTNTGSGQTNVQSIFKGMYDFFLSHPNMTLIARNGGTSGTAANVDYWDGANPFLNRAWYVFRMNDALLESGAANPYAYSGARGFPWYVYVQYGDLGTGSWNTSPANPSALDGVTGTGSSSYAMGMAFAIPVGTTPGTSEVAWNGGGTLGTNTKGTPVWRSTAGTPAGFQGCYVFPRSNNVGGSHVTNRENTTNIYNSPSNAPVRYHIVADDDSFSIAISNGADDGDQYNINTFALYTPRPGITVSYPMVHLPLNSAFTAFSNPSFDSIVSFGNTTGTVGGGIPWNSVSTDGVRGVTIDGLDEIVTAASIPNNMFGNNSIDYWNLQVLSSETSYFGYAGDLSFIRYVPYGMLGDSLDQTKSWTPFNSMNPFWKKILFPWSPSATPPRTNFTRNGITF